ncbi:MAG: MoxR family ATPase [Candidatus Kapabacteria bacterium]|jgi:MoxR-like ATPase|nr:MoxR family ATPase [Candidatus Kapabacteria bacterium]
MNPESDYDFKIRLNLTEYKEKTEKVKKLISEHLIGNRDNIDMVITSLIAGGHILLEGVPGIAKTLMAKLTAATLSLGFARIQFTPDLMPSDITGTSVFNPKTLDFELRKGPVFTNVVLADEINRAPAKTQSALFEVMEEKQVTIDGVSHKFSDTFLVIATQNPIEQEGTYRLPEAQIDRFGFKLSLDYPDLEQEIKILELKNKSFKDNITDNIQPIINEDDIKQMRSIASQTIVSNELLKYIASLVSSTRKNKNIYLGASPRAGITILNTSKAYAALNGRDFVTPDDVVKVAYPALRHRLILTPEKEMEGISNDEIISEIISQIEVPR